MISGLYHPFNRGGTSSTSSATSSSFRTKRHELYRMCSIGPEKVVSSSTQRRYQEGPIALALAMDDKTIQGGEEEREDRQRVSITYEEESEVFTAIPANKSKVLGINVDLMLVGVIE